MPLSFIAWLQTLRAWPQRAARPAGLRLCGERGRYARYRRLLLTLWLAAAAALALPGTARADIWAYVDGQGVTHFAAEPLDERYRLFFQGDDFDSQRDGTPRHRGTGSGLKVDAASVASAGKLAAYFSSSAQYQRVRRHVEHTAQNTGLDYELLKALIATESGFDVDVVSPKGAVGLMQLLPATAERFGVRADARRSVAAKLTDPATNLQAGARYLKYLIAMFPGRLDLALAAYNAGENAVKRFGQAIPPYKETQNYVRTVLALYEQLQPGASAPVAARGGRQAAVPGAGRVRMELRGDQPAADLSTTPNFLP
ncbi:lytic transglycosylase domain-containing protein [Comamonas sp. 17RB]|uniref:lytic transglycosylase domain-containing protein n=1 Tax=Comamonas sp. 17RB TaxID=3047025 RepID=UPI0024B85233|nr:lytic transglycosylase domain-containing protein [Comamonas sp. 17RB]MDI9855820.1 lytic transglycosylase domain-containing protein [Comamonas sp. 17RB]